MRQALPRTGSTPQTDLARQSDRQVRDRRSRRRLRADRPQDHRRHLRRRRPARRRRLLRQGSDQGRSLRRLRCALSRQERRCRRSRRSLHHPALLCHRRRQAAVDLCRSPRHRQRRGGSGSRKCSARSWTCRRAASASTLGSTVRSTRALRPTAISAARRKPTAASRGRGRSRRDAALGASPEPNADRSAAGTRRRASPATAAARASRCRPVARVRWRTVLPQLAVDSESRPDSTISGTSFRMRVSDVRLEIGFGGGEHLVAEARAQPDVGFIGVEPFVERHGEGGSRRRRRSASATSASSPATRRLLLDWLPPASLAARRPALSRSVAEEAPLQAPLRQRRKSRSHRPRSEARRNVPIRQRHPLLRRMDARPPHRRRRDLTWTAERAADWRQSVSGLARNPLRGEGAARRPRPDLSRPFAASESVAVYTTSRSRIRPKR